MPGAPGATAIFRLRQRAKRSTVATANGSSIAISDELDRPAANEPLAEIHVAPRGADEARVVQRRDERLGGAADVGEAFPVHRSRCVPEGRGRAVAGRRQRERGDAVADERALLVEAEGETEVGELAECAGPPGARARLLGDPGGGGLDQGRGRRAWLVARDLESRRPAPGDRVEVDDREDPGGVGQPGDEADGAETAE